MLLAYRETPGHSRAAEGGDDMTERTPTRYDPREFKALTFHAAVTQFEDGSDTPRAYLERCLETIAAREGVVQAFVVLNQTGARSGLP